MPRFWGQSTRVEAVMFSDLFDVVHEVLRGPLVEHSQVPEFEPRLHPFRKLQVELVFCPDLELDELKRIEFEVAAQAVLQIRHSRRQLSEEFENYLLDV